MSLTVKQLNVLRTFHQATAEEIQNGMLWYRQTNEEADHIAEQSGKSVACVAGIIAAMSPGLRWETNVEAAERVIRGEKLDGLGVRWYANVRKARKIVKGHNPDVVLRGNKVKAFAACITNPSNEVSVCIDGHCYSIWCGRRIPLAEVPALTDRLYYRIAGDFTIVARNLCLLPMQMQAIVWLTHRRLHGVTSIQE